MAHPEAVDLRQRYSDAPPARLTAYTAAAFVAAKTCAWLERAASSSAVRPG